MIKVGENWYMQAKYTNPICVSMYHLQKLNSFDILTFKNELPTFLGIHPFFYCHGLKQKIPLYSNYHRQLRGGIS